VNRLAEIHTGEELQFLLERVNDWVPEVANAARRAVESRCSTENGVEFARHLRLVARLVLSKRRELGDLIGKVVATVSNADMESALGSDDSTTRMLAFRTLLSRTEPREPLLLRAMCDPALRRFALGHLLITLDDAKLHSRLALLDAFQDRGIRRTVFRIRAKRFPDDILMTEALLDADRGVRELAQYFYHGDAAAFYRERIGEGLPMVIEGIGETGNRADAELLVPFLKDPRTGVRAATAVAIGRLDSERYAYQLLKLVADEKSPVSRAAAHSLRRCAAMLDWWDVVGILRPGIPRFNVVNVLRVTRWMSKWDALAVILAAHPYRDASSQLRIWIARFNRSQVAPSSALLDVIRARLDQAPQRLADEICTLISSLP
jgi:HEAT repeat protein